MLYMPKTRSRTSMTRKLHPLAIVLDEGLALVAAEGGTLKAGTGLAGEVFAGLSIFQRGPVTSLPYRSEKFTPKTGANTMSLPYTPLGGTLNIFSAADSSKQVAATDYTYDAGTNTITWTTLNVPVVVAMEYSPTAMQLRAIQGDVQPGGVVPQHYDIVGILDKGDVFTSCFEQGDNWNDPNAVIRVGANGKLTTQGSGAVLDAYVVEAPSHETPYLGICLR